MRIYQDLNDFQKLSLQLDSLTIGQFDGVHRGHLYLISQLFGEKGVLTFAPSPKEVVSGHKVPSIMSLDQKLKHLEKAGVDHTFVVPFDLNVAKLSAEDFAQKYIFNTFRPREIIVGYDFAFGKNREGDFDRFRQMAKKWNYQVKQSTAHKIDDTIVSSSLVRENLREGRVRQANQLLGYDYYIQGKVIEGQQLGRSLGFPTANIETGNDLFLKWGVYLAEARLGNERHYCVCNLGQKPSVISDGPVILECFLLDFDRDIYGEPVSIHFLDFLRAEQQFATLQDLKQQIQKDVEMARTRSKSQS